MADMMDVGGIRASIGLSTGDLDNALAKVDAALKKTAADMAALQQSFAQGSLSATDFATQNAALERSFNQLSKAAQSLTAASQAKQQALGQSISYANAWGNVAQQSAEKTKAFGQALRDADKAFTANGGVSLDTLRTNLMHFQSAQIETSFRNAAGVVASAGNAMRGATGDSRNLGFAMMQLGAMADDAAYGFRGVLNNIMPLVLGLSGGNMALAGAAQIAASAGYQLYEHWDQLMELFGKKIPADLKDQLRELAAEAVKAAEEVGNVAQSMQEQQSRVAAMEQRPSKEQAKASEAYKEAIAEGGAGKIEGAIAEKLNERGEYKASEAMKEQIRKDVAKNNPMTAGLAALDKGVSAVGGPEGSFQKKLRDLEEAAIAEHERQMNRRRAANLLEEASGTGPNADNARKQIAGMVEEAPAGMFPAEFGKAAVDLTPENRKQQEQFEDQGKANEINAERDQRQRKANADKAKEEHARMVKGLEEQDREAKAQEQAEEHERKANADKARAEHARMARQLDEQDRQAEEHERDVMGRVDDIPGMKKFAEGARLRERFGGGNALDQIKEALTKAGYSEDDANMAAHNLVTGADKSISGKVSGEMGKGEDEQRRQSRNSEVFATSDLAHKVQQAVGGENYEKKNVDQNEKMIQLLARIAEKEGFRPEGMQPA